VAGNPFWDEVWSRGGGAATRASEVAQIGEKGGWSAGSSAHVRL